jgi:hypothetical protein
LIQVAGQSYKFTAADHGAHLFRAALSSLGMQSLTASDTMPISTVQFGSEVNIDGVASAVGPAPDPLASGQQALIIVAPANGGSITIMPHSQDGTMVSVNIVAAGMAPFSGIYTVSSQSHIIVCGQGGNLVVKEVTATINQKVTYVSVPAVLLGGSGTSTLSVAGSSANNIVVGGTGKDVLTGGTGRDILIGEGGSDTLNAGSAGDVLIGGITTFDANLAALEALLVEWQSNDSYQTRVQDLFGNGPAGPGGPQLNAATIINDLAVNQINASSSGPSMDWIWLEGATDKISGGKAGEIVTVK